MHSWLLVAALVTAGCNAGPQAAAPVPPTSPLTEAPPPAAQAEAGGVAVSFKTQVVPILQAHCAKCHVQGNPKVPFTMFNQDGSPDHDSVAFHIAGMVAAIRTGKMPKDKPGSVSEEDIKTLEAWGQQGAKDN